MRHNGKKVDPNAYSAIELFGKHTTGCEVIQKNDKKEKNGAVTKTKSGAINILNAMMKSPQLIEVYKQKNQWPTYVIEETGCNSNFKIQFKGKV